MNRWQGDLEELSSAEEFLQFFGIEFDECVVHVHRLHILQRFHDYLAGLSPLNDAEAEYQRTASALRHAYEDFVRSDARTEKVFKVFRHDEPKVAFVPIANIARKSL